MGWLPFPARGVMYPWLIEKIPGGPKDHQRKIHDYCLPLGIYKNQLIRNGCDPSKIAWIPHGIDPMEKHRLKKIPIVPFVSAMWVGSIIGRDCI